MFIAENALNRRGGQARAFAELVPEKTEQLPAGHSQAQLTTDEISIRAVDNLSGNLRFFVAVNIQWKAFLIRIHFRG